jgi:hypothetical protein
MVDFGDGKASLNDENAGQRVRCVRVFEGHAGTGRVVSAGAPPEQYQRFNAADTAIKDKKTRLCWERPPPPEPMWKQEAEKHCREEPPEGCSSAYRLPAVKELMTLVDEQSVPVLADGWLGNRAIDGNAFPNTPAESFWTSTPKRIGPDVWGIRFDTGEMTELSTNSTARYYVRCVTQE